MFNIKKQMGKYCTIVIIATFWGFSFNAPQAFADNHGVSEDRVSNEIEETEAIEESTEEQAIDQPDGDEISDQEDEELSLVPGDFFYFVKKLQENVQLAFTFDDVKEAELLTEFVDERIREAEALFAKGEEELAIETLETAIKQQEEAFAAYEQAEPVEAGNEEMDADKKNLENAESETESDEEKNEENVGDTETEEVVYVEEPQLEDDSADDRRSALEARFSSNLLALQAALEKVGNPQAKESLAKNVAKAQDRLERKVIKFAGRQGNEEASGTDEITIDETDSEDTDVSEKGTQEDSKVLSATDEEVASSLEEDETTEEDVLQSAKKSELRQNEKKAEQEVKQVEKKTEQEVKQVEKKTEQEVKQ
ncbi:DUF5667 domain-containing protein, partial [Oceanobacillus damuensis]|uniref:DUF5667 domain-containing protein n=1 Tax=Oceanobacillus damuensis TaxID=937928 RepID=UPI000829B241